MEDSILKFFEQFDFNPEIQNADKLKDNYEHFVMAGMGGSHLAAGLFHIFRPGMNLYIHRDYGLPPYEGEFMEKSLLIANSYSGNTEETVDFAEAAYLKGYDLAIITKGGKLLEFAKKNELPYVLIPDTGIQPRAALGFQSLSLASFVDPQLISEIQNMKEILDPESLRAQGYEIAQSLQNKIPIIYSSTQNRALSYVWKIKLNETGKVPAFYNVFPELNHNEMQGFDPVEENQELSKNMHFLFLHDSKDDPHIELRMKIVEELYQEKGFSVTSIFLEGDTEIEKIFKSVILSDWVALGLAKHYGTEPEDVPLVEEFKKRIAK